MKVKIIKKKDGSFESSDGSGLVAYFWYTASRQGTQGAPIRFQFGSSVGWHEEGAELDLDLYQGENSNGRLVWKEAVEVPL